MKENNNKPTYGWFLITCALNLVIFPAIILGLAGDWLWVEGWIFGLWLSAMVLSNVIYLYLRDPALLAERSKRTGSDNQKQWDKILLNIIAIVALLWLFIVPLDAHRFRWSPRFPIWIEILGGLALIPALYLIYQATVENTFLSTRVRIQTERKQHVITTGVYGFVRHPLYLGCLIMLLGGAMLLGSLYGFIIGVLDIFIIAGRIFGEEKMLAEELEGYEDYQNKVRYRLLPYIW